MATNIIFLGAPGAGKGTQAAVIAKELKLTHIATGDMFRQSIEKGAELGLKAKSYMEKGLLVPDEITIQMMLDRMAQPDCKVGAVLDGFPRNLKQAEALDKALAKTARSINKVLYIKVSEKELLERLGGRWICRKCQTPYHAVNNPPKIKGVCDKCGGELYQRPDDRPEAVKQRLQTYFSETAPLIEFYTKAKKLVEINGEGALDEVSRRLIAAVNN